VALSSVLPEGGGWAIFKLAVGVALVGEGALLAMDAQGARRGAAARLQMRSGRTGRVYGWILRPTLLLVGFVCLGVGALQLVDAARELV
jgi:hypothetical protein